MITKIEINGFKTFEQFSMEFSPFVIIAGSNGSGKSNLFDAIKLLSSLAEKDLKTSFSEQRGIFNELFTLYSNGHRADKMQFVIELFLDKIVKDPFNTEVPLGHRRLRYDLHISRRKDEKLGIERLYVDHEMLTPMKKGSDKWAKNVVLGHQEWESEKISYNYKPYINTEERNSVQVISIRQDGIRGGKPTPVKDLERSVLSGVNDASFPHAFAVREEMLSWRQFQLSPIELSKPSSMLGYDIMDREGRYLASMLKRIEVADPNLIKSISRNIQNILPEIKKIFVDEDSARQQYILMVEANDGRIFSANVLSEGTLRIIALCALKFDDEYKGLMCFEEPENGIHPFRMNKVLDLLKDLSTDFNVDGESEYPLRQVIINTHSPVLVTDFFERFENHNNGILFYSRLVSIISSSKNSSYKITRLSPVHYGKTVDIFLKDVPAEVQLTHSEVIQYLKTDDAEQSVIAELSKA